MNEELNRLLVKIPYEIIPKLNENSPSFDYEYNYKLLYDYIQFLETKVNKSLSLLKAFGGGKIIILDVIDILGENYE